MIDQILLVFRKTRTFRAAIVFCAVVGTAAVFLSLARPVHAEALPTAAEKQAVLEPINRLFKGMSSGDQGLMMEQMLPDGSATLYRNGQFLQMSLQALADRIGKIVDGPDHFEERIYDPLIRIDDNIAVVWASYNVYKNGKVDYCGTDLLSMVRRDGHWLIASVTDNSRRNCAAK
jgi:Putative lumazine-binding